MRQVSKGHRDEPPILLVKWYHVTKWLLERVDSFPKNQRFIFGQRIADRALNILEALVEAAYSPRKADLLAGVKRPGRTGGGRPLTTAEAAACYTSRTSGQENRLAHGGRPVCDRPLNGRAAGGRGLGGPAGAGCVPDCGGAQTAVNVNIYYIMS